MARGQGEGTIVKLKNGTYQGRLTIGYDENGKQMRKAFYGKTKREVQEKMNLLKVELNKGIYSEYSKMTMYEWLDIWLRDYKKRTLKPNTYRGYYNQVNHYIKPVFGEYMLRDLKPDMIQRFYNDLSDRGLSAKTIIHVHCTLQGALEQAVENELIAKNPSSKSTLPKIENKKIHVLSVDEQKRFVEVAKRKPSGDLFILILCTGLRIGEALALTWDDVDLDEGILRVNKTQIETRDVDTPHSKTERRSGTPKTKASVRTIPLISDIIDMLKEKKRNAILTNSFLFSNTDGNPIPNSLIFPNVNGLPMSFTTTRERLERITREANIYGITPHALRHTFATRGMENGIEMRVMQELLGHSSLKMTADIYTHVTPDKKKDSIAKLQNMINL